MASAIRVTWDYDCDPDLSYLEQWDTPEKYYDLDAPCPKCGSYMEYSELHMFVCCDPECSHSIDASTCGGSNAGVVHEDGEQMTFEDYQQSYGDLNKYVSLQCTVETRCTCCGGWTIQASLGGVDFYTYGPDQWDIGTFDAMDIDDKLGGYQLEESYELILEAMVDHN
jgi:hypothetical protein